MKALKAARFTLSLVALVGGASCLDITNGGGVANSEIRVVNASGQALNIFVDDRLSIDGSVPPNVSLIQLPSGPHKLTARTAGGVDTDLQITATPTGSLNTYAYTNSSGVVVFTLLDTTTAPTGNVARVRAINLSKLTGTIDIYASSEGSAATKLAPTFDFLTKTPYAEKASGSWEVYYTAAGSTTKLKSTGVFAVEASGRRTVVVLDSASIPTFRVLPN